MAGTYWLVHTDVCVEMTTESIGGHSYLSLSFMTTPGAEQSTSLRERLKSLTSSSYLKNVLQMTTVRTLPNSEGTMEENTCLKVLLATWDQKGSIMSWLCPTHLNRTVLQS